MQEVDNWWNSTHYVLQRLVNLREPVGAALASLPSDIMPFSSADFEIISQAPFKYATTELSEENRVLAWKIISIIWMMQHKVAGRTGLGHWNVQCKYGCCSWCTMFLLTTRWLSGAKCQKLQSTSSVVEASYNVYKTKHRWHIWTQYVGYYCKEWLYVSPGNAVPAMYYHLTF